MNNNKLIAEFMGYTFVNGVYESPKDEFHIDEMLYDTWDWLMPVVHKIDKKCRERLGLNHSLHIGDDIDAVYHEVVEFIKTYNHE